MADSLQPLGYRTIEACGSTEALRVCDGPGEIDVMITDVIMPDMNGIELAEAVRKRWPGITVIFTSGYTDGSVLMRDVLEKGAAFLQKPITPKKLRSRLRQALNRRKGPDNNSSEQAH